MRPKAPKHKRKPRRLICKGHLNAIRQLPCVLSGRPAEAAHVNFGDINREKFNRLGVKADDCWTVSLAPELHRLATGCQHDCNEELWWRQFGVNPLEVAESLWDHSPNIEVMTEIVNGITLTPDARARVLEILRGKKS